MTEKEINTLTNRMNEVLLSLTACENTLEAIDRKVFGVNVPQSLDSTINLEEEKTPLSGLLDRTLSRLKRLDKYLYDINKQI